MCDRFRDVPFNVALAEKFLQKCNRKKGNVVPVKAHKEDHRSNSKAKTDRESERVHVPRRVAVIIAALVVVAGSLTVVLQ